MALIDHRILIVLDPVTGTLRGAQEDRLHDNMRREDGIPLDAATLAAVLPQQAALMAQVQALIIERDAMTGQIEAERATEITAKAEADAALATAQARIAELEALLAPVDAQGFPVLSAVQVRLALLGAGIRSSKVQAIIDSIPDEVQRDTAHTYWDYAVELHRDHPMIAMFGAALGLTTEQVDAMWRGAASL